MTSAVSLEVGGDGVLVATMNLPGRPMNVVGDALMEGIGEACAKLADPAVKGMILTSGKADFCAGGDLDRMSRWSKPEEPFEGSTAMKKVLRQLELQHGEIRERILSDELRVDVRAVEEVAAEIVPVLGHVAVRHHVAFGGDNHATPGGPLLRQAAFARPQPDHLDPDDRGEHALQHRIVGRRRLRRGRRPRRARRRER